MDLSWPIAAAVLVGALLHAGWNTLVKSSGDKTLDTALVHALAALVALPVALAPRAASVPMAPIPARRVKERRSLAWFARCSMTASRRSTSTWFEKCSIAKSKSSDCACP